MKITKSLTRKNENATNFVEASRVDVFAKTDEVQIIIETAGDKLRHKLVMSPAESKVLGSKLMVEELAAKFREIEGLRASLNTERELLAQAEDNLRRIADHLSGDPAKAWNEQQPTALHLRQTIFEKINELRREAQPKGTYAPAVSDASYEGS